MNSVVVNTILYTLLVLMGLVGIALACNEKDENGKSSCSGAVFPFFFYLAIAVYLGFQFLG